MKKKQTIIILSLLFIVGAAMIYLMLYKPLVTDVEVIKNDLEIVQLEYETKQAKIEKLKVIEEKLVIIEKDIKKLAPNFYGEVAQEELIVKINDLCVKSKVRVLEIKYNGLTEFILEKTDADDTEDTEDTEATEAVEQTEETEATETTEETEAAEKQKNTETTGTTEETEDNILYGESFSIGFAGTYKEILKILKLIDKNDKAIANIGLEINTTLNVTSNIPEELRAAYPNVDFEAMMNEEGELSCQIELIFFKAKGLEEFVDDDYNILKEKPQEKSTSKNPFAVFESFAENMK